MKKKLFTLLLVTSLTVSLIACGNIAEEPQAETQTTQEQPSKQETETQSNDQLKEQATPEKTNSDYDNSSLEGILTGIESDFANTIKHLQTQFTETSNTIGDTYDGYVENKQALADWYALILIEENELFTRTKERSVDYFKLISSSIDHKDDDAMDDAMDEYYDRVYDGVMDDFYDAVYDDLMDDAYDTYYDGIVSDGYDVAPYDKWLDESSDCYEAWLDTSSDVYENWLDTSSDLYEYWLDVNSGFFEGNYDVEDILKNELD